MPANSTQDILINIKAAVEGGSTVDEISAALAKLGINMGGADKQAADLASQIALLDKQAAAIDALNKLGADAETAQAALAKLNEQSAANAASQTALAADIEKTTAALVPASAAAEKAAAAQQAARTAYTAARTAASDLRAQLTALRQAETQDAEAQAQVSAALTEQTAVQRTARAELTARNEALREAQASERALQTALNQDNAALAKAEAGQSALAAATEKATAAAAASAKAQQDASVAATAAAVDVTNLATEETRVAAASTQASAAVEKLAADVRATATSLGLIGPEADKTAAALKGLNIRPFAAIQADIKAVQSSLAALRASGTLTGQELVVAEEAAAQKTAALRAEMETTTGVGAKLSAGFGDIARSLGLMAGVYLGFEGAAKLVELADGAKEAAAQLKLVTSSTDELDTAQTALLQIADETRVSYSDTVNLYARLARSTTDLGLSQSQLLAVTKTVNESLIVGGSSADEASRAVTQFSQGLAAGTLRGQDLNSVLEQAPGLAKTLADGLGITVGQLRAFAQAGQLTAGELVQAIQSQEAAVDASFAKMPLTIGGAMTQVGNALIASVGKFDAVSGASSALAADIQSAAGVIGPTITVLGGVIGTVAGDIRSLFDLLKATFNGVAAGVAEAASLISLALSKITFGSLSQGFATAADALEERAKELGKNVGADLDDINGAADQMNRSIGEVGTGLLQFADNAQAAAPKVQKTAAAANAGAAAVSGLGLAAKTSGLTVQSFLTALSKNADKATSSLRQLSAPEFTAFAASLRDALDKANTSLAALGTTAPAAGTAAATAFTKAQGSVSALNTALQDVENEALKRLGVDADLAATGVTTAMTRAASAITVLGENSKTTAAAMTLAFNAALGKATTQQDAQALITALENVKVSGFDAAAAIKQVQAAADSLPSASVGAQKLADAFRTLGVTSSATLDAMAQRSRAAFQVISESASSTQGDVDAAFGAMAAQELQAAAAAGDVSLAQEKIKLQTEATDEAQSAMLDALMQRYPQLGDVIANTWSRGRRAAADYVSTVAQTVSLTQKYDKLMQDADKSVEGFAAGIAGIESSASNVLATKYGPGAVAEMSRIVAAQQPGSMNPFTIPDAGPGAGNMWSVLEQAARGYDPMSLNTGLDQYARDLASAELAFTDPSTGLPLQQVQNAASSAPSRQAPSSGRYAIDLTINGQAVSGLSADSAADAEKLIAMLQQAQGISVQ